MARKLNKASIDLIKKYEKCVLKAYLCPAGKWTIGWGNTFYENGTKVKKGDVITQQRADELFENILDKFSAEVESLLQGNGKAINDNQFGALVSFAYNLGSDIDADTIAEGLGDSTLLKKVNKNPIDKSIYAFSTGPDKEPIYASCEFLKWVSHGSNVEKGLKRRRRDEAALYSTAI